MIIKRIFKGDWLQSARDKRPGETPEDLVDRAQKDPKPENRLKACKLIVDLSRLQMISTDDEDAGVRECASSRLEGLLSGTAPESPDLETRKKFLVNTSHPSIAVKLALEGPDPQLRIAALARIVDEEILGRCALEDGVSAVRHAAAERLHDKVVLERVARGIGKRDKSVHRMVREKLKRIAEQEQAPARTHAEADALCGRAEKLGIQGTWSHDKALMDHLDNQWSGLTDVPPDLEQRFLKAREEFLEGYRAQEKNELERARAEQEGLLTISNKQGIIEELTGMDPGSISIEKLQSRLEVIKTQWNDLDRVPRDEDRGLDSRFRQLLKDIESGIERERSLSQAERRLSALKEQAQAWLEGSSPLQKKQLEKWQREGDRLSALKPGAPAAGNYNEIKKQLEVRLEKQTQHASEKLDRLPDRLALFQEQIDEGELKKATALHQSLLSDMGLIEATGMEQRGGKAGQQLHQLAPRLRELQKWRKWGTDQHRVEMCEKMEQLTGAQIPLEDLTEQVRSMQADWKKLDRDGSRVNEGLKERFHRAADTVYDRCRPYLEEVAQRREEAQRAREALCEQLETFLERIDWERVDWKKLVHAERDTRTEWGRMAPVDPRHRKHLDKRYRNAIKALDAHLVAERSRNRAMKQELIEQARMLADEPDLDRAMVEVKALQRRWHTTVPSKRAQENRLWEQFRENCNKVFDRRRELQTAHQKELKGHTAVLRNLCVKLEELLDDDSFEPDDLLHEVHRLQGAWSEGLSLELPRHEIPKVQRRWDEAVRGAMNRIRQLREALELKQLGRLCGFAELCRTLESELETMSGQAPDITVWQQRWSELPPLLNSELQSAIEQRFNTSLDVLLGKVSRERWMSGFGENLDIRRRICLKMEILAGIDSPNEYAEDRLAFQVNRLSERLAEGEEHGHEDPNQLEQVWYLTGPLAAEELERLQHRFDRAREALG